MSEQLKTPARPFPQWRIEELRDKYADGPELPEWADAASDEAGIPRVGEI